MNRSNFPYTGVRDIYDATNAGAIRLTDNDRYVRLGNQWARDNNVPEYFEDNNRVFLLLIDMQVDFVRPDGALSVAGAVEDTDRLIRWFYQNMHQITSVGLTLDSHLPIQIFHPAYWRDRNGNMPDPYTQIEPKDYLTKYVPIFVPDFDENWNKRYLDELKSRGNKTHTVWTTHTLIGSPGYSLIPALSEAITFWSAARGSNPTFYSKGTNPFTESYGGLESEVHVPTDPGTQLNIDFIDMMGSYDEIWIAGQAKSHCVYETVRQMVNHYRQNAPDVISKLRLMQNCMSSIVIRDPNSGRVILDFDTVVMPEYEAWANQYGLQLVNV
jgi:nicotinamidase-related amidase